MNVIGNQYHETFTEQELLPIVKGVVRRYVQRKAIPNREREDVEMEVLEKFLKQKDKIYNAFEGKSKFSTYCIAVINRMCCEVIRKECKQWYLVPDTEDGTKFKEPTLNSHDAEKQLLFKLEVNRLQSVLYFFNNDYAKLVLFLKVYFSIPICNDDINSYANSYSEEVRSIIMDEKNSTKGDVFIRLAGVVNIVEQKEIGGDAVRIWFTNQVNIIIRRLNGNGIANHDKESLSILLEMLFNDTYRKLN